MKKEILLIELSYYEPERYSNLNSIKTITKPMDIFRTIKQGEEEKNWYRFGTFMDMWIFVDKLPDGKIERIKAEKGVLHAIKSKLST